MRALLDVNVLIALLDGAHVGHDRATTWLEREIAPGCASCPLTQNGCIRIMSQPAHPGALPAAKVAVRLAEAARGPAHAFWPDDLSLLDDGVLDWTRVLGHRQVTDNYRLALAVRHGGRFVTFDARVDCRAVQGATASQLVVLV
jgi:toxin-antitoxin system PIN domain toxin